MFDSHCHLDAEEYDGDRDEVLARARVAGVTGIMVPGYEPDEWQRLLGLCALDPRIVCAVGLHPLYLHELTATARSAALCQLGDWLEKTSARAVGEFGLDALVTKRGGLDLDAQAEVARAHLKLARELDLPVIVHCVRAHGRLLELLEELGPHAPGGVMHAYGGPAELVGRYAKLNFRFSFGGIVTHPEAKRPRAALAAVPRSLLLVETDGPSQVPRGSTRSRSEPADVAHVLAVAAELRGESEDALSRATAQNACALFRCDPAHFAPA
ncbi:MAG: TatD-related deoxyribonuclease [Myxococcaceae bacterium]|nr:TatD-related deoxyribonuclease [Myxococcaceae bacterium]